MPMIRSIASMPLFAGSRSSRTAPGSCSTTAASASAAVQTSAATTKPGSEKAAQRAGPVPAVADHHDDQGGAVSPVPGIVAPGC